MLTIRPNTTMHFKVLNEQIRETKETDIVIENCIGQRYIASGDTGKSILIKGIPGNALGAYLDGTKINVHGNVQDATGDTMNDGAIIVHGNAGDATGYAMRGGEILVLGNTGYRTGIHMKAYKEKQPLIVIGEKAGSFLGEYQAGGTIVVLGLSEQNPDRNLTGAFCATGMHGGQIFLRTSKVPEDLPKNIDIELIKGKDSSKLKESLDIFCEAFGMDENLLLEDTFCCLIPNTKNPYRQMYVRN